MDEHDLADQILTRLALAAKDDSGVRFIVSPSIDRSGGYRVSYPGGRFNARPELIQELLNRKLIQVVDQKSGSLVVGLTIRGFDYFARHLEAS